MHIYWTIPSYRKWVKLAVETHPNELLGMLVGVCEGNAVWIKDFIIPKQKADNFSVSYMENPHHAFQRFLQANPKKRSFQLLGTIHTHCSIVGDCMQSPAPSISDIVGQRSWEMIWAVHHIIRNQDGQFSVEKPVFFHRILMIDPEIEDSRSIVSKMRRHRRMAAHLANQD